MTAPVIVGAGLAGLVAAHAWPGALVMEVGPEPSANHKALLRFRSDAVARLTGLEFRRVMVRKGLWSRHMFRRPNIALANAYSRKVLGRIMPDRSIWNLDPVERFIAPEDIYEQLSEACYHRVSWGVRPDDWREAAGKGRPVVSTAPLPDMLAQCAVKHTLAFHRAPITVARWRVPDCDVFQTVYFPDEHMPLYRASITGSLLIAEFAGDGADEEQMKDCHTAITQAFGIRPGECEQLAGAHQRWGKIAPVEDHQRKGLLAVLTKYFNVYSLGRFATWRNILLDDVVQDIDVVKRLMRSNVYEQSKILTT